MQAFNKKIIIITSIAIAIFFASSFFFKNSSELPISLENSTNDKNDIIRNEEAQVVDDNNNETKEFQGTEEDIIKLINNSRHEQGLPDLVQNEKLSVSAMKKAGDMEAKQYFEHVSPDGLQPWFFAEEEGYDYKNFGENLAEGFFSAESVHKSWMESSGHRDNILSEEFSEVGVAILGFEQNGLQSFLVVEHFGTQFEPEESIKITCSTKLQIHCIDAEKKKTEVKHSIETQEELLKKMKKEEAGNDSINKVQENLNKLNGMTKEIDSYLDKCENLFDKCEEWK